MLAEVVVGWACVLSMTRQLLCVCMCLRVCVCVYVYVCVRLCVLL